MAGFLTSASLAAACTAALAGRPLVVDDANTNEKGTGHVETWVERAEGATVVNVAPAYAPLDGLEFAAALSRDTTNKINASAVQLKWRITESLDNGCNLGTTLGAAQQGGGDGHGRFVNGLLTCNARDIGSVHFNLGLIKPSGSASLRTWGVAFEHAFGPLTPHIETFGEKGSKPTLQIGARTDIAKGWQLDGTIGRRDGENLYTLGMKFQF